MSALDTMKSALQEARTEAATLRIRVRELEVKLVEVADASELEATGLRAGADVLVAENARLVQESARLRGELEALRAQQGAAATDLLTHPFVPAPFYPSKCDAILDDRGRQRTCARPRAEHQQ